MQKTLFILLITIAVSSCQKVIDLKLKDAGQQYVIEGNIINTGAPSIVTLSKTQSYNTSYSFSGVSGAAVTISDDAGNSATLPELQPGIYQTSAIPGVEGRTYKLNIVVNGSTFTSTSTMPHQVNFDSLYVRDQSNWDKTVKTVVPVFTDPVGQGNAYRFNQYINGVLDKSQYYQDDDFTDGQLNSFALLRPDPDSTLHVGDHVEVDMQCIDKAVYKYWFSFDQSQGDNGGNIPSNPVTNIQGGALGYFSAHTSQRRSLVVK